MVKDIGTKNLILFKSKTNKISTLCRCKDIDLKLKKYLVTHEVLTDRTHMKHILIVEVSDYRTGFFVALRVVCIKYFGTLGFS